MAENPTGRRKAEILRDRATVEKGIGDPKSGEQVAVLP